MPPCDHEENKNQILNMIELAVSGNNEAFLASGVKASLRLVGTFFDPDYVENLKTPRDILQDDLQPISSGFLDGIHLKRNEVSYLFPTTFDIFTSIKR